MDYAFPAFAQSGDEFVNPPRGLFEDLKDLLGGKRKSEPFRRSARFIASEASSDFELIGKVAARTGRSSKLFPSFIRVSVRNSQRPKGREAPSSAGMLRRCLKGQTLPAEAQDYPETPATGSRVQTTAYYGTRADPQTSCLTVGHDDGAPQSDSKSTTLTHPDVIKPACIPASLRQAGFQTRYLRCRDSGSGPRHLVA